MAIITLSGRHISARSKPFEFTDRDSGEIRRGESLRAWLLQDGGDGEPVEIRFRAEAQDVFNDVAEQPFGVGIVYECDLGAVETRGRAVPTYSARRVKVEG